MDFEPNAATWGAFAGASRLPSGKDPEFTECAVPDCPDAPEIEGEFTAVLSGPKDDGGTGAALTLNAMTYEGYPVVYEKSFPTEEAARAVGAALSYRLTHAALEALGFEYEGCGAPEASDLAGRTLRLAQEALGLAERNGAGFVVVDALKAVVRAAERTDAAL